MMSHRYSDQRDYSISIIISLLFRRTKGRETGCGRVPTMPYTYQVGQLSFYSSLTHTQGLSSCKTPGTQYVFSLQKKPGALFSQLLSKEYHGSFKTA